MDGIDRSLYLFFVIIAVIVVGLVIFLYYTNQPSPTTYKVENVENVNMTKWVIETRIEDDYIVCEMTIYYNQTDFKRIMDNWDQYKTMLESNISQFKEPSTSIRDLNIKYIVNSFSVHIYFKVLGALTKDSYHHQCRATFLWLLRPLGLDFIDDHFQEFNDRLTWSGELNGVYYDITILLPKQDKPYKACASDVGHCHGHVWWPCY